MATGKKIFHSLIQREKIFTVTIKLPQMTVRLLRTPFLSCYIPRVSSWPKREIAIPVLKNSSNFNLLTIKRQMFSSNVNHLFRKRKRKMPLFWCQVLPNNSGLPSSCLLSWLCYLVALFPASVIQSTGRNYLIRYKNFFYLKLGISLCLQIQYRQRLVKKI